MHCLGGPATSFSLTSTSISLSVVADSRSEKLIHGSVGRDEGRKAKIKEIGSETPVKFLILGWGRGCGGGCPFYYR